MNIGELSKIAKTKGETEMANVDTVEAQETKVQKKVGEMLMKPAQEYIKHIGALENQNNSGKEIEQEPVEPDSNEVVDSEDVEDNCEKSTPQKYEFPIIQKTDRSVVLCNHGKYSLNMMPLYNSENLVVENCRFYLEDMEKHVPMIGSGEELKLSKHKLMLATDHGVMNNINKFIITFSDNELKQAFERAKIFLENVENMVAYSSSMTISDTYCAVVRYAIEMAENEDKAKVMEIDRKCQYKKEENEVWIRDSYIQEVLDAVGSGFSKGVFGKKISMLEGHYGVQLIVKNRGRYGCNTCGNIRYYKIKIVEALMGTEGGAA